MTRLPSFRQDAHSPLWRSIAKAYIFSLPPAFTLALVAAIVLSALGVQIELISPPAPDVSLTGAAKGILVAPLIETIILAAGIKLLWLGSKRIGFVAFASGVLWGALHATQGLLWFFAPTWSFFIFTLAYLAWREKSFMHAFAAASVPHALSNATLLLAVALGNNAA